MISVTHRSQMLAWYSARHIDKLILRYNRNVLKQPFFEDYLSSKQTRYSVKLLKTMVLKNLTTKDSNENGNSSTDIEENLNKKQQSGCSSNGPFVMPLIPVPKDEENGLKASIILSGTAKKGEIGPSVGAVDIGISKSAYFFQVALPGVKKDPGQFCCEIERDGKVHIRGEMSTGGKNISRHSRVFQMKFQQQPPPGPFTVSFTLPGPVDPRLFYPNFRSDAIFEAIVIKCD